MRDDSRHILALMIPKEKVVVLWFLRVRLLLVFRPAFEGCRHIHVLVSWNNNSSSFFLVGRVATAPQPFRNVKSVGWVFL